MMPNVAIDSSLTPNEILSVIKVHVWLDQSDKYGESVAFRYWPWFCLDFLQ